MLTRRQLIQASIAAPFMSAATRPPNVVFILTDDQGWYEIGVNGNPNIHTPVMDRLAAEGMRLTQFYASPVCSPTRAALMTGRHYQRTGAVDTYLGRDVLHTDEVTLGEVMRKAGYRTACIGKWHLGRYMKYHPLNRGFDEFFGFWQYGFINRYDDSDELWSGKTPVLTRGYVTDVLTDQALSFIEANSGNPFFLYLPYNAPHVPHLAPDALIEPYLKQGVPLAEARIYAMIASLDRNIGRILDTLEKHGLSDNTIVFFMSDNGGVGRYYKAGLRDYKGSCYEGGVRVPFFVRWPGRIPAGTVRDAMAQHVDIMPTVCDLAGVPAPAGRQLDGRSLGPLLRGASMESPHDYVYHQWNRGHPVLATVAGDPELKASWAIRDARGRKLMMTGELFDLQSDPGETRDIAAAEPGVARDLRTRFEGWFADVTAGQKYERVAIEVGRADENPVEIDLTWGEAQGVKVRPTYRSYNLDVINGWSIPGEGVAWKLDVVRAGRYEVVLNYGLREGDGGKLQVAAGHSRFVYEGKGTGGREVFRPVSAGVLELQRGLQQLRLTAVTVVGDELMALHKIWLRRI